MWVKLLRILAVVGLILVTSATPVFASNQVTVTYEPEITNGLIDFTITYVNDKRLDFTWGYVGDAVKIMIRGKYGAYPANIPDENTTPSDGYLVYYGSGTSTSDTSMDFDQNPGALYYTAWAQRADDTWHTDIRQGWKESKQLVLIALIILPLAIMGMGYRFKQAWLMWLACPFWVMLGIYLGFTESWFPADAQHSLILIGLLGTIGCIFVATHMNLAEMEKEGGSEGKSFWEDWGDEIDDGDKEAIEEHNRYKKASNMYHTKRKPRRFRYP